MAHSPRKQSKQLGSRVLWPDDKLAAALISAASEIDGSDCRLSAADIKSAQRNGSLPTCTTMIRRAREIDPQVNGVEDAARVLTGGVLNAHASPSRKRKSKWTFEAVRDVLATFVAETGETSNRSYEAYRGRLSVRELPSEATIRYLYGGKWKAAIKDAGIER